MSQNLDSVWGQTQPGEVTEEAMPPVGTYVPMVSDFRAAQSKKGEFYVVVTFQTDQHLWSDVRVLTKNGVPQEGRIKACKIMLRQLGINPDTPPSALAAAGAQIVGRYYAVDVVASDRLNQTTGMPILNTNITGPASAPTMNVAPAPQAPPQVQAPPVAHGVPVQQQTPQQQAESAAFVMGEQPGAATFPSAVPGQPATVVPQQPAPGAQFGDQAPWS